MLSSSREFQQGSLSTARPKLFGPRQPFPHHKPVIRLLPQCPEIPPERHDAVRSTGSASEKGKSKDDHSSFFRSTSIRKSLRSPCSHKDLMNDTQSINITPLRRQSTDATFTSETSSQDSQTSIRVVGRGGHGSRARQVEASLSNDQLERSSVQVRPSLVTQTASDSNVHIRIVGRGGRGSKQRHAVLPQPQTLLSIKVDQIPSKNLPQKPQVVRYGGRGGSGSFPSRINTGNGFMQPSMPTLGLKIKNKLKAIRVDPIPSLPLLKGSSMLRSQSRFPTVIPPLSDSLPTSSFSLPEDTYHVPGPEPASQGRGLRNATKLERTLGLVESIPDSSHSQRTHWRASRSLSSLADLKKLRDSSVQGSGDTQEFPLECWVDNRFDSTEDVDSGLTPVSPIVFSEAPVPQPQRAPIKDLGQTDRGLTIVTTNVPVFRDFSEDDALEYASTVVDEEDDEDDVRVSSRCASPTTLQITPDTPHSIHSKYSSRSPDSPILFREENSSSLFFSTKWPKDDLHVLYVDVGAASRNIVNVKHPSSTEPHPARPATLFETHDTPKSPFFDIGSEVDPKFLPPSTGMDEKEPRRNSRRDRKLGWSGEWNRDDIEEVIHSLRQLK